MKGRIVPTIGLLGVSSLTFAYNIIGMEKGLYGKIELSFSKENWKYKDGYKLNIDRTLFLQNYQLGFDGYLFRPKFLHFNIGGNIRIDKSKYVSDNSESTTTLKGTGYNLDFRFFRGTFMPIRIYFSQTYAPTRIIAGTFQQDLDTRIKSRGGTISFVRSNFYFTFSKDISNVESIIQGINYTNDIDQQLASLNFSGKKSNLSLSYTEIEMKTVSPFYNYYEKNKMFSANLGYTGKTWMFTARGSYTSSRLGNYELYSESLSLSYFPTDRFNLSLATSFNQYRGSVDTEYYSVNQNLHYRFSDNWSLTQNASFYSLENTSSATFGAGIVYSKAFSPTLRMSLSTSGSYSKWMNSEERNYYSYALSGNISKDIPKIRSSLTLSSSHSSLYRDGKEASRTFSASEMFTSRLGGATFLNHSVSYIKSASKEYDYEYEMVRSSNSLSWRSRLFRKMTVDYRLGIDYWKFINTGTESVKPYTSISGSVLATRRLSFRFSLDLFRDTLYKNEYSARGTFKMKYTFRKVNILWDNGYNKEVFRDGFNYERSRYYTSIKLTRSF